MHVCMCTHTHAHRVYSMYLLWYLDIQTSSEQGRVTELRSLSAKLSASLQRLKKADYGGCRTATPLP